ncbi:Dam family site-specific DNA-(adenine-N6)-methyltransferase [Salmonella enterica]|uniref:Dam family site-specific DNA-(adenine-N6)-methyltransferase n=1 Tax=Salmonella enterica TaxID=28901 RepID=UPI0003EB477C|nr:Dam family site-specific DNA-(adenine-N6)-methyltransferase [Salmonella enterica]EAU5131699.1 Dam family site-specific DNA-(adenine-N6)-methyltransferase [Salmonella enterica subsp. enterica serovar Oranienburg]EBK2688503.1 Dam family site-specific DNA-(adenine-N6)-methyltransferase [Salmonella enterica subsp. enterica serovar Newport]ECJ2211111.1 Dam family site-specific DNA-(adenine-N6)-methyltransferase [Salmonella enterica subsp. diarizonae]EBA1630114.1 Dam family site-specific DNA-(aden
MSSLSYGSVCSGIEAASIAWEPLGMSPAWFSEIEPFPCAVLAERWPEVPNLGDMTQIAASVAANEVAAPDLLVGGTPCQAFSIAGLRKGLADKRGQLTLAYVELVNAIDYSRIRQGLPPVIFCWENVPGVLSSKDNAFGCLLAGLAGEDEPFKPGPQPERGKNSTFWRWDKKARKHYPKWPQSGCVVGRQRKLAWRVLDAEYFGVPQRRHRVFVVGSAGEGFDPETILFEFEGVRRNTPPSKETWQTVAALTANGVGTCGADDNQGQAGHLQVVGALAAHSFTGGAGGRPEGAADGHFIPVAVMAHGQGGAEIKTDDSAPTLTCNHEAPIVFSSTGAGFWSEGPGTLRAREQESHEHLAVLAFPAHMSSTQYASAEGVVNDGLVSGLLSAGGGNLDQGYPAIINGMSVRRLTPLECERLQGFPDFHTLIPAKKRNTLIADELAYLRVHFPDMPEEEAHRLAADGPRYKALGNSMAVPVMRWIGKRIIERLSKTAAPAGRIKPFLKWAGGKFGVIDDLLAHMPHGHRLIEPFAGGGSIFLNAGFDEAIVSDACQDLILTYQVMQREPLALIDKANVMFREGNNPEYFDDIKVRFNRRDMTQMERAAAFIYLNRHCYNGLMRYNRQGEFNVGFGKYRQPYFPLAELEAFSAVASRCTFAVADCNDTVALAGEGDVVFCDPPYEPMPGKSGFTNYSGQSFRFDDQVRLAQSLKAAHQRGASVVITNSGAPAIRELYTSMGFDVRPLRARRSISCTGETRETVTDIIGVLA